MKRIIIAAALAFALISPPRQTAVADTPVVISTPAPMMDVRHIALGNYFSSHNCPLLPYVDDFITAADKSGIDWRLLPAISIHESTCGKRYPVNTNNPFGWLERRQKGGELTVAKFTSIPTAISFITEQLANGKYYAGKTIRQKLATYCPSPNYPTETISYMNLISKNEN